MVVCQNLRNIRRFIAMLMRYRYSFLSRTRRIKSTNSQTLVQDRFKYYFPIYVQITKVLCVIQIFLIRFSIHFAPLYISCTSHPTWFHLPNNVHSRIYLLGDVFLQPLVTRNNRRRFTSLKVRNVTWRLASYVHLPLPQPVFLRSILLSTIFSTPSIDYF
jgi:hypothetical protein